MAACESPLVENTILMGTLYPWKNMNPETTPSLGHIFKDPLPPLFHHVPTPSSSSFSSSSSSQQPEEEEEICMEDQEEEVRGGSTCNVDGKNLCAPTDPDPLILDLSLEKEVRMEEEEETEQEEEAMKEAAAVERNKQYYYLPPRRKRKGLVFWRSRSLGGQFPPPISSISVSSGKPWMYFKSYRREGRLVLKKVMLPSLELLHASREDGRVRMHFIHRSDE